MPPTKSKGCPYVDSFGDRCGANTMMGDEYCHEHIGEECAVCGSQATRNCGRDGPAGGPCGFALCSKAKCHAAHAEKWHK